MKILRYFLICISLTAVFLGCTEKDLLIPDTSTEGTVLESLSLRPSLRPDSVKAYGAFYNTVEIVFPKKQPDRAVSAGITYTADNGQLIRIDVKDFNQVVAVENLSIKEHYFTVVYYTAEGKASKPVTIHAKPYLALTEYVVSSFSGSGAYSQAILRWNNITTKEVEIEVSYDDNGVTKSVKKLSSALQDSIKIESLVEESYNFRLTVRDLNRGYESDVKVLPVNMGLTLAKYALTSLVLQPSYGRATVSWTNPISELIEIVFKRSGNQFDATESSSLNGQYLLKNLEEGIQNIEVFVRNKRTGEITESKLFSIVVLKGVKETVLSSTVVSSFNLNLALLEYSNFTSTPVSLKVEYNKVDGQMFSQIIDIPGNTKLLPLLLNNVSENANIHLSVTDDIGTATKTVLSKVKTTIGTPDFFTRTGWAAYASSQRNTEEQSAKQVLDGGTGSAAKGWVNQWGSGTIDSLGKSSTLFPHYLKLDMKTVQLVTAIDLVNHQNSVQNGPGEFTVQYSFDGDTYYDADTFTRPTNTTGGATAPNARTSHILSQPILARFVKLYITKPDNSSTTTLRIGEVYVKGLVKIN